MQTVVAMAAIANGGVLLRPFVVQKVVAADGTTLLARGREEVRRVLEEDTARELAAMLEEVVEKGTGTRAALLGHRVAGKTGTAQKVDPIRGGYSDKRLASFLGFAPADSPRVAILVVIDEPEGKGAEVAGGTVAAPAWGAIAHEALRQLDVMPEQVKETAPLLLSSLGSGAADEAAYEREVPPIQPGRARVPDVSGLGARSAMRRLAQSSLEPELRGSGRAVAQSPRAGSIVKRGARVKVTLAPPG
jgi:cell division protein FtsI (penicillin-binding protein 3)